MTMKALAALVLTALACAASAQSSLPACDQQADEVGIPGKIKNSLPLKARKEQIDVYVFYSGHGLPSDDGASLYLLPHGAKRQYFKSNQIPKSLFQKITSTNP